MARGNNGGRAGRSPGAMGGGGPRNRRPSGGGGGGRGYTGGTNHKSSSVEGSPVMTLVWGIAAFVVLTVGSVVAYMVHGYGLV